MIGMAQMTWLSVQSAVDILGLTPAALRKSLDRRAALTGDGGIEAEVYGVRGRKFGRLWRVMLSPAWTVPSAPKVKVLSLPSQILRDDREGTRS